jgi:hypothetical protein
MRFLCLIALCMILPTGVFARGDSTTPVEFHQPLAYDIPHIVHKYETGSGVVCRSDSAIKFFFENIEKRGFTKALALTNRRYANAECEFRYRYEYVLQFIKDVVPDEKGRLLQINSIFIRDVGPSYMCVRIPGLLPQVKNAPAS